ALMDRDDPDDLAVLVRQQRDPGLADQRGVVPVAAVSRAVWEIEHHFGHPGVVQPGPDIGDEVDHEGRPKPGFAAEITPAVAWVKRGDARHGTGTPSPCPTRPATLGEA